jgi:hypothetical protein
MTRRLTETLAGPWTDADQRRLNRFLKETPMPLTPKAALAIARAAGLLVRNHQGRKVRRLVRSELTVETSEAALFGDCETATMGRYVGRHAEEIGKLLGCRVHYDRSEYTSTSTITLIPAGTCSGRVSAARRERRLRLLRICRQSPADPERCAGRPAYEEGPDSDAALAAVADGATQGERDELERLRLASGGQYDSGGQLLMEDQEP